MNKLLADIVSLLDKTSFCANTKIIDTTFFSSSQFAIKIRTSIFSAYVLQIRIYYNSGHFDYSFQVFDQRPLCRWDNKEHFPWIKSHPHHFHSLDGMVEASPLIGEPIHDLKTVLRELKNLFG